MMYQQLLDNIKKRKAAVAVIGLGYVGLPLSIAFVKKKYKTIGFDVSKQKLQELKKGVSYIDDVNNTQLRQAKKTKLFSFTDDFQNIKKADCIIICVPTPLSKTRQPDLSFVISAVESISKYLKKGQLVILESTTYPGTTEEVILPILEERSGLTVEKDFFLAFSPERVDPANSSFGITDIPKVIGSHGPKGRKLIHSLYERIFKKIVPVSSPRAAEMVKLLENTFRSVNIGLINEFCMICQTLKIDIWEVIEAAKTKPYGFMPFYPGPGIGGHCINIDPLYLSWKSRLHGYEPRMVELAQTINDQMPDLITSMITDLLNEKSKSIRNSKVLLVGLAYKKNVRDMRESPSLLIAEKLLEHGARLSYHDTYVPHLKVLRRQFKSQKLSKELLRKQDLVVVLTAHDNIDYKKIADFSSMILDTRNALKNISGLKRKNIRTL